MQEYLKQYFKSKGIEYFAVLDYSDCVETNTRIMKRELFVPRSVIIYLLPYYTGETVNLSRYAASLDYHIAINEINQGISGIILERFPNSYLRGYGDHSPIDERHAALIAGLGIAGENGLIINERYGSYVFVGDIVTSIDPRLLGATEPMEIKRCHGCGACKRACPTGILRGEGTDCLSAITQRKGELAEGEIALMRKYNTVWGCDLCQQYCPYNKDPVITPIEFFKRERIAHLTRELLDEMDEETFKKRAFAWRKRATVERNLELVNKSDIKK